MTNTTTAVFSAEPIAEGMAALGLPAQAEQVASLAAYLSLMARWNAVYNLTSVRDPDRMRGTHLLDSLSVLPTLRAALPDSDAPASLVDVGSGAGLPGLPLAICWPALTVTLVEPVGKKAAFLRQAVGVLGLQQRVQVQALRVEQWRPAHLPALVISRAFASLTDYVRAIDHLVDAATGVFAMKGLLPEQEIAALPAAWRVAAVHPLVVPELDAARHLIQLARQGDNHSPE